ncbi:MAG: hypothetical protein WCI34_04875 [Actinomycetes bacterium]
MATPAGEGAVDGLDGTRVVGPGADLLNGTKAVWQSDLAVVETNAAPAPEKTIS